MKVKIVKAKFKSMLRKASVSESELFQRLYSKYHDRSTYKNKKYLHEQIEK